MGSPAHDDSLVFADDARLAFKQYSDRGAPNTSNFSPMVDESYELTQLDQSTSPVFHEKSFSSDSENNELLEMGKRQESLFGPTQTSNSDPNGIQRNPFWDASNRDADTQIIPVRDRKEALRRVDNDTQMISPRRKMSILDIVDSSENTNTFLNPTDRNSNDIMILQDNLGTDNDTQVIRQPGPDASLPVLKDSGKEETSRSMNTLVTTQHLNDTQVIRPRNGNRSYRRILDDTGLQDDIPVVQNDTQVIQNDTQVIQNDTHVINNIVALEMNDTQVILKSTQVINNLNDTQVIPQAIQDTQVIPQAVQDIQVTNNLNDTQVIPQAIQDTQVIPQAIQDTQVIPTSSSLDPKTSPLAIWKNTQPITQVPILRASPIQIESSPEKNFEFEPTLVRSPSRTLDEPTTQVLNTQEDLIEEKPISDFGQKLVYSSGQTEEKLHSDLGIVSNDDDLRTDDNDLLYEDSVFRHQQKRRRLGRGLSSYPESEDNNEINDVPSMDTSANIEVEDTRVSDTSTHDSTIQESAILDDADILGNIKGEILSLDAVCGKAPDVVDPVPQKLSWSQSSSELEDVSHEVPSLDLDALPGGRDEFDESADQILLPTKRRRTQIPPTQSQEDELRSEDLDTLLVDAITEPSAVWAFSQFKHFPARVIRSDDESSYVEFPDDVQEVKNADLYLLDLRLGDVVHVMLLAGQYTVTGMATVDPGSLFKCIRGYDTVYLAKKGRVKKEIVVALSSVFMEMGEWASHQQKFHILYEGIDLVQENFGVVRKVLPQIPKESQQLSPKKKGRMDSNLFEGMFFFVTSIEGERKTQLADKIMNNGGVFIDDEIKHYTTQKTNDDGSLYLSLAKFGDFRFGALLSDGYSRSAKYIQALALGWPILADSFVDYALQNPDMLEEWLVFLLPAGHSLYTNVVRSMEVYEFRNNCTNKITMNGQFGNNLHLLTGHEIVILNRKQDARTLDMCRFVFHAFGARLLQECLTVGEINRFLNSGHYKNALIYDNGSREYTQSKKRSKLKQMVGVIDWEWVVQCAISGYIWRPATMVAL